MDWRCRECGRVRDTRAEPCDCGAHEFERATVNHTKRCTECGATAAEATTACPECGFTGFEPLGVDRETAGDLRSSYVQWRCPECGRTSPRNAPPCDGCGNPTLEREVIDDESFDVDEFVGSERVLTWRLVVALLAILAVVFLVGRVV